MSTRCNIIVKSEYEEWPDIILYHHHDGYPSGVGYDLFSRLQKINGSWFSDDIANLLVKDTKDEYEITVAIHGDIEYLYTIDCKNKTLVCNVAHGSKIGEVVEMNFKGENK